MYVEIKYGNNIISRRAVVPSPYFRVERIGCWLCLCVRLVSLKFGNGRIFLLNFLGLKDMGGGRKYCHIVSPSRGHEGLKIR